MSSLDSASAAVDPNGRKALEVATPDCVADDFDGEIVVLNISSGVYFSLRDLAAAVWRDLAAGHSPSEVATAIGREDAGLGEGVRELVDQLLQRGLMRARASGERPTSDFESLACVRAGNTQILFEAYEDMKDLILADPIHDADDQMGWPVIRTKA